MLQKAATSFSPFKLQHLHNHLRHALNLGNAASSSAASSSATATAASGSSNALGGAANHAGGAGGAKWHAGRSYSYQAFGRGPSTPAANATAANDGSGNSKVLDDEQAEEKARLQAMRWRNIHTSASRSSQAPNAITRRRASSLTNPGLTTGVSVSAAPATIPSILPRSSPYSFNQAQLQARYRHAFSRAGSSRQYQLLITGAPPKQPSPLSPPKASLSTFPQSSPSSPRGRTSALPKTSSSQPLLRRNSTSASPETPQSIQAENLLPPTSQKTQDAVTAEAAVIESASTAAPSQPTQDTSATSPADVQLEPSDVFQLEGNSEYCGEKFSVVIQSALNNQDTPRLRSMVRAYRADPALWNVARHCRLIEALYDIRSHGPFELIVKDMHDLYTDYNHKKLRLFNKAVPSYMIVVHVERSERTSALLQRQALQNKMEQLNQAGAVWSEGKTVDVSATCSQGQDDAMYSPATLAALQQQADEDYQLALKYIGGLKKGGQHLTVAANSALLRIAGTRGDIDTALAAFGQLEGTPQAQKSWATAKDFEALLSAYAKSKEWQGVDTVFDGFLKGIGKQQRDRRRKERTAADLLEAPSTTSNNASGRATQPEQQEDPDTCVWNAMIHAKLMQQEGPTALELLEEMMSKQGRAPKPIAFTLTSLVKGFAESGELDTAFRWADRIHTVPSPPGFPSPPPKLEDTLNTIIAHSPVDIPKMQDAAQEAAFLPRLGQHIAASTTPASTSESTDGSARSPSSSASSSYGLGSVFSDTSIRTQSLTVTPPELASYVSPDAESGSIDTKLSAIVDELIRTSHNCLEVYGIVKSNRRDGKHVHPEALARLLKSMSSNMKPIPTKELQDVYQIAYNNIANLPSREEQGSAWAYLEDRILIAMANLGELDKVAMHRDRLLQAGAAPSADAYAAMINCAKDTTDDATVARELFEEALRFGVVPNLYLYNILISKLSKARRTHLALSYFEQMKQARIRPSTVTYGSVIAACCRTGDEKAAVFLFEEMKNQRGYVARIPPYNTMIQFFTTTRPDREKALSYFEQLLKAGVQPTAHTYKLLLDVYGGIAPVDIPSVNDVFGRLVAHPNTKVTGAHWVSLMNAYGIGANDLNKALEVFDAIEQHPSSPTGRWQAMPDNICYEGLFNILLHHKRTDLVESYIKRMEEQSVRSTAYISNTLIKAYAASGNVDKAREIFESLSDPPSGVHASGNHANEAAPKDGAVYREPSTFEAMIRCEIAAGEVARAEALLQRAVGRAFPSAILAKMEKLVRGEEQPSPLFAPPTTV